MKYPLTTIAIGTRDGTLTKDSKSVNTLGGQKRPGFASVQQLVVGAGQGMMVSPTLGALAIVGNSIYRVSTGALVVAIPSGTGPYDVAEAPPSGVLVFKDANHIWTLTGSTVAMATRASAAAMVPGIVFLDGTYYVLSVTGELQGSGLNDPTTWAALNYVSLNADVGLPVAVARQLNYVIGFADTFTMFYYDAGNPPPGSPLAPVQSTYSDIGCAAAGSIVEMGGLLMFLGKSKMRGRAVYSLVGTSYQVISDPLVDKILERSTLASVDSFGLKIAGRDVYCLTLKDLGVSLVLDLTQKQWQVWTSSVAPVVPAAIPGDYTQTYITVGDYVNGNGADLFQHESNGKILQLLPTTAQDDGLPIDVHFVTQIVEGASSDYERIKAAEIVGDKVNATAYIRFTDDDYQTWSGFQSVNLLQKRSRTVRQGATRRRAYHIRHTANTALNLRSVLLDLTSVPVPP